MLPIHDNIFRVQFIVQTPSGIKLDFFSALRWSRRTGLFRVVPPDTRPYPAGCGRRPALVLSRAAYNEEANLARVSPLSSRAKGYPFEVLPREGLPISGVVLSDHLKSLDWKQGRAEVVVRVRAEVVSGVLARLAPLLGF